MAGGFVQVKFTTYGVGFASKNKIFLPKRFYGRIFPLRQTGILQVLLIIVNFEH